VANRKYCVSLWRRRNEIEQEKEKKVYDVTFVAPTINTGKFIWEGTEAEAIQEFTDFLNSQFEPGTAKILEFVESLDQQLELPLPSDNSNKTFH
jgi:hypothetical protein